MCHRKPNSGNLPILQAAITEISHADHVAKFVVVMCTATVCFVRFHNNLLVLTECKYIRLILTFKAALQIIV